MIESILPHGDGWGVTLKESAADGTWYWASTLEEVVSDAIAAHLSAQPGGYGHLRARLVKWRAEAEQKGNTNNVDSVVWAAQEAYTKVIRALDEEAKATSGEDWRARCEAAEAALHDVGLCLSAYAPLTYRDETPAFYDDMEPIKKIRKVVERHQQALRERNQGGRG